MAIRTKRSSSVRRVDRRRINKVQKFSDKKIQAFEDVVTILQKAVDSYRNACPERIDGPVWADVRIGSWTGARTIHYTLSSKLLRAIGVRRIRVHPTARRVPKDHRTDQPPGRSDVGRRLLENAGVDYDKDRGQAPPISKKGL